jgi:hypothetical protein
MNYTPRFKLKFKLEILEKLQKGAPISSGGNHRSYFEEFQFNKMSEHPSHKQTSNNSMSNSHYIINKNIGINSSKNKHSKYTMRNSKFFTGDIDNLPGYNALTTDMPLEEKEELLKYIKNCDNGNILFQSFHLIYSKKYFSKIKSKNGTNIILNMFKDLVKKYKEGYFLENKKEKGNYINNSNKNAITENLNERNRDNELNLEIENEIELYMILKNIMELTDIDAFEIFNIFKYNESFTFTEKHFMYLFYLFSSFECNCLNDFITLFGDEIFEELSSNEKYINVSRMRVFGEILNIPTQEMNDILQKLKMDIFTPINQEKFMSFYINLGKKYSTEINNDNILMWNMGNNSNKNLNNHGFSLNKNFGNNYSQNIGNNIGNKIYTLGSLNRKDNKNKNNNIAYNQKRIINNFHAANFQNKTKVNRLTKKIHFKK